MKLCNGPCNTERPFEDFHKGNGSFGLKSRCKDCCKISYKKRTKEWANKYYKENAHKLRAYKAAYYLNNLEKERLIRSTYEKNNKWLKTARENKRRSNKLLATPKWLTNTHFNQIKAIYAIRDFLSKLLNIKLHVDHIVPLQGTIVKGLHVPWNLQLLTELTNLHKSNKVK